jgi:hypothetical protein
MEIDQVLRKRNRCTSLSLHSTNRTLPTSLAWLGITGPTDVAGKQPNQPAKASSFTGYGYAADDSPLLVLIRWFPSRPAPHTFSRLSLSSIAYQSHWSTARRLSLSSRPVHKRRGLWAFFLALLRPLATTTPFRIPGEDEMMRARYISVRRTTLEKQGTCMHTR